MAAAYQQFSNSLGTQTFMVSSCRYRLRPKYKYDYGQGVKICILFILSINDMYHIICRLNVVQIK